MGCFLHNVVTIATTELLQMEGSSTAAAFLDGLSLAGNFYNAIGVKGLWLLFFG